MEPYRGIVFFLFHFAIILNKIISKAIATRLTPILGSVVSQDQHGFIKGRSIYDNILAAKTGIDYIKLTKQECILLQLDLDKDCGLVLPLQNNGSLGFRFNMCWTAMTLG